MEGNREVQKTNESLIWEVGGGGLETDDKAELGVGQLTAPAPSGPPAPALAQTRMRYPEHIPGVS